MQSSTGRSLLTEAARACGARICGGGALNPRSIPNFSSFSSINFFFIVSHAPYIVHRKDHVNEAAMR